MSKNPNLKNSIIHNERGLTLVEILAVIVLISLIYAAISGGIFGKAESGKAQLNAVKMDKLKSSLAQYKLQFNTYPASLNDLVKPSSTTQKSGMVFVPMAEDKDLVDIWSNDYVYKSESGGRSYSITSLGADGAPGGSGADQDVTLKP